MAVRQAARSGARGEPTWCDARERRGGELAGQAGQPPRSAGAGTGQDAAWHGQDVACLGSGQATAGRAAGARRGAAIQRQGGELPGARWDGVCMAMGPCTLSAGRNAGGRVRGLTPGSRPPDPAWGCRGDPAAKRPTCDGGRDWAPGGRTGGPTQGARACRSSGRPGRRLGRTGTTRKAVAAGKRRACQRAVCWRGRCAGSGARGVGSAGWCKGRACRRLRRQAR